jgi:uncharacterized repeat protein (TIGR03803 family)
MRKFPWLLILLAVGNASGQNLSTESVLHTFCTQANCADGYAPAAGLTEDASGNFYGTTSEGGSHPGTCPSAQGCGTVFRLDRAGNYTVLYNFCSQANCADGETPQAGLAVDASGNLFGTTLYGGAYHIDPNGNGGGTAFKLDSAGNYKVLYNFCSQTNCTDGYYPYAGLTEDASGNLYGTALYGGANRGGTAFKLDSSGNYTVLHTFCSQANCTDGYNSYSGLTGDAFGNLYGTTFFGGAHRSDYNGLGGGTVFKLDSAGTYAVLYNFCSKANCTDGFYPYAGVIEDASGNLYGNTYNGGNGTSYGGGVVFKLDSTGNFTVLHIFCALSNCPDGGGPVAGLMEDSSGRLFGTTTIGGPPLYYGAGVVYEVSSIGNSYSIVYEFCSQTNCADGYLPYSSLVEDASGNLYGTTNSGGSGIWSNDVGVIFRLTPPVIPSPDFTVAASPTTVTIGSPGQQGTATITITPTGGFNQTITFSGTSCSGLPTGASCSFNPSSATPSGGAVNTTLTISTTATSSAILRLPFMHKQSLFLALVLPGLFILVPAGRGKRCLVRGVGGMLVLLFGLSVIGLSGCGGGSASGGGGDGGGVSGGTPAGTYTITVTATAPSLTHVTTLTLVVN